MEENKLLSKEPLSGNSSLFFFLENKIKRFEYVKTNRSARHERLMVYELSEVPAQDDGVLLLSRGSLLLLGRAGDKHSILKKTHLLLLDSFRCSAGSECLLGRGGQKRKNKIKGL